MLNSSNITTIYVSQKNGDNLYSGFYSEETGDFQGPLMSIECALGRVADLRRAGACQPIDIVIVDDIYEISKPVYIKNSVSQVTIKGLNNTIISGGVRLEGFKEDKFNGTRCFSAIVPEVKEGFSFTDFYVDEKRADNTHLPKEGFYLAESVEDDCWDIGASSKWFIARKEDIEEFKKIKKFDECIISYNHYWIDEHTPIESYDFETGKIVFKYLSRYTITDRLERSKLRYKLEHVREAFENPNEWYLDKETATVYYVPRDDEQTPETIKAYIPLTDRLFIVEGSRDKKVENINFENITFAYTRGEHLSTWSAADSVGTGIGRDYLAAEEIIYSADDQSVQKAPGVVSFKYALGCAVEKCTFRNLGLYGLEIDNGCNSMRVYGNKFYNLGAGGIKLGGGAYGCDKAEETFSNIISQNIITECGRRYDAACGILMKHTYSNIVSHNEISYIRYTGISLGWVWGYDDNISRDNILEKNHIHHIGYTGLSDMGGIYALGIQPGSVIRGNVIHDVESRHYGGYCIYTDEGSSYMLIEDNICYGANSSAFHQHYGKMNTVRNNIFVKSGEAPVHSSRVELHPSMILERNIIVSEGTESYATGYDDKVTGHFYKILGNKNIHFDTKGETKIFKLKERYIGLEEAQNKFGIEKDSISADPKFCDYENNDFSLKDDSPAYKIGFKKIDTSDVGVTIKL